ncbi:hypothetical protein ACFVGY_07275 [Streptomyces sp. NPDC127106]|uniref:hypothetical protein n=1 Tax=Streptomyces sp. NPDC127106 TaxID=3345360 RepID=UPI0036413D3D
MSTPHGSPATQALRTLLALPRQAPGEPPAPGAAARALEETRPARTAAAAVAAAGGPEGDTARRLAALVRDHLGGSAERWLGVHDALAAHRGTLPELLAAAPQPVPSAAAPGGIRPPAPRSALATLALLLEHAPPEDAAAALAALPDRSLDALLATGALPGPAVTAAVVEHGDARTRTALARHTRLDSRVLARLLDTADPAVGAAVYRNPRATQSLRRTLAQRLDRVPMDERLYAELSARGADLPSTWLAPLLVSGDPQLTARALTVQVRGTAQQYALARVWERSGQDGVRAVLDDPDVATWLTRPVASAVADALAADDGAREGLRRLREHGEPYEDPARLPALLTTTRGTNSLRVLLTEPYAQDARALAEAHAASPFMPKASEELARHEAADDAQRLAFRLSALNDPWQTGARRVGNTAPPAQRLAGEALDDDAARWAEGMAAAGLLDPLDLVRTGHPAVHALGALARLAERKLLTGTAVSALAALADDRLGERPEAWAAFDTLLPGHPGTLAEVIAEAGDAPTPEHPDGDEEGDQDGEGANGGAGTPAADRSDAAAAPTTPTDPSTPSDSVAAAPPAAPRVPAERAALAALDLLRTLAPGDVPPPADPGVLRFLAHPQTADVPALTATPQWLIDACAPHGIRPPRERPWPTAPTRAELTEAQTLATTWGSGVRSLELAYAEGLLPVEDMLARLPARFLLDFPHDWRPLGFAHAWRDGTAHMLRAELGTDPDAWLRLADTVEASGGGDRSGGGGPGWVELLRIARSGDTTAAGHRPLERNGTEPPRTPDEAIGFGCRGVLGWRWPIGTLLCLADADVVDAVLPRLGPDGPWKLASYLQRHDRTPRPLVERLSAGRDPQALRVLASGIRRLSHWVPGLLAGLGDPDVDVALLRNGVAPHLARRIVGRSRPGTGKPEDGLGARVLDELRNGPKTGTGTCTGTETGPVGGIRWLASAEPDLIEEVFARHTGLSLAHQVVGCLHLAEHGGPDRLAALVARGVLGQAATTLCVKALRSGDPVGVLRARAERELAPAKLITRMRRHTGAWQSTSAVWHSPYGVDWQALEAAHEAEPLPQWSALVNHPDAPTRLRLRHPGLVHEPGAEGLPDGPELTRARARHGLGSLWSCALTTQLDGLLAAGHLGPGALLHLVAPAARVLAYLGGASRRTDAPAEAAEALAELAALVAARLGTDAEAWERVVARLTGRDPQWDRTSPVAALFA